MKNYVYLYYNTGHSDDDMEKVMQAWRRWFGSLGDKLVDAGNPFNEGAKAVSNDGVMDVTSSPATGYSIVKAETMEEATRLTANCPVLQAPGGAVCVYETLPM